MITRKELISNTIQTYLLFQRVNLTADNEAVQRSSEVHLQQLRQGAIDNLQKKDE